MQIEVRDLSFSYPKHPVLQHLSFSIPQGELVALLGPNGAGKSTLFRCILGFLRPEGEILLRGRPVRSLTQRELSREIAYIPQSAEPIFNYTVLDTVLMGTTGTLQLAQRPGKAQLESAHRALEQLEIAHLANRGISQVSGGERQLALIARALVQNAAVLIMDEPTANLDYGNQQRVMARVCGLTHQGYTVLVSTHNPEHALRYASQVLALQDGSLCAFGPTAQTLTPDLIDKLYGIHVTMAEVMTPQGPACSLIALEE